MKWNLLATCLLALASSALVSAQETSATESKRMSKLCVIPISQSPVTRIENIGKDELGRTLSREAAVDPKLLPPPTLTVQCGEDFSKTVSVVSGSYSADLSFPHNTPCKILQNSGGKLLATIPASKEPQHYLIVLHPAAGAKDWTEPKSLILPQDWTSFPDANLRVVNLSAYDAAIQSKNEKMLIRPSEAKVLSSKFFDSGNYLALVNAKGTPKLVKRGYMSVGERNRANLFIYNYMFGNVEEATATEISESLPSSTIPSE